MKLLFDQNLSEELVGGLEMLFPGSKHVVQLGLDQATDREIWDYAAAQGFAIVSKDSDFRTLAFLSGPPPKVIWIRAGNAKTVQVLTLILDEHERLFDLDDAVESSLLVLDMKLPKDSD